MDGQQRLTTSIILIQAILENFPEEKINYFTKEEIRKRFIFESKDEGISRSYIFGYEKDNPSYEFLKTAIFLEHSENDHRNEATIYTQNLEQAKLFFKDKIKELSSNEIEAIYKKVTQHFLFNIYSMSEDIDVHVAFESMNNRGKPLSILELLKNRLIYLTTKFDSDEHEKNKLRHTINEAWKTIYHYLGKNKDKPLDDDVFLLNHFFNHFAKDHIKENEQIRYRTHYRHYKYSYRENLLENHFTAKSIYKTENPLTIASIKDYVSSLKNSVGTWFDILNPQLSNLSSDEAEILGRIYRLEPESESEEFLALLLSVFEKTTDKSVRIKLLNTIEQMLFWDTFMDYSWHSGYGSEFLLRLSIELSRKESTPSEVVSKLQSALGEVHKRKGLILEICKKFKSRGFYTWPGIRYFLYEYEQHLRTRSKTKRHKLEWEALEQQNTFDYISIEHIYPQSGRKQYWATKFSHYSPKERAQLKNALGNLLPLSKPKNSSLKDKSFSEKKMKPNDPIGYAYGCYSENQVALCEDWTAVEILKRSLELAKFFSQRWQVHFPTHDSILEFTGISFVIDKEKLNKEELLKDMKLFETRTANLQDHNAIKTS